jgi:hypothetical protein
MLKVNFDTFNWYRPRGKDDRFRWSDEKDPLLLAGGRGCQEYTPKDKKALFRTFAELGGDRDQILAFANRFGLLVGRSQDDRVKRGRKPGEDWPISAADMGCHGPSIFRLSSWVTRIAEMKSLVDLVELMTNDIGHPNKDRRKADPVNNRDDFLRALRWQPPDATRRLDIGNPRTDAELAERAVAKIIDKYKAVILASTAEVSWDSKDRRPILSIVPIDLGHFLYWQLCDWFFDGAAFRQCEVCGKWERPARPDCWSTCSLACRSKKHRNEKKKPAKKRRAKQA